MLQCELNEILMQSVIMRQLWVERSGKQMALLHSNNRLCIRLSDLFLQMGHNLDLVRENLCNDRRADKDGVERLVPHNFGHMKHGIKRILLRAKLIAIHTDIKTTEKLLSSLLCTSRFVCQHDHACASTPSRLRLDKLSERFQKVAALGDQRHGRRFASRNDKCIDTCKLISSTDSNSLAHLGYFLEHMDMLEESALKCYEPYLRSVHSFTSSDILLLTEYTYSNGLLCLIGYHAD